jgi:hypothetical protein
MYGLDVLGIPGIIFDFLADVLDVAVDDRSLPW